MIEGPPKLILFSLDHGRPQITGGGLGYMVKMGMGQKSVYSALWKCVEQHLENPPNPLAP